MPHTRLYHAADMLMRHRAALEEHLFGATQTLFPEAAETVTLYDLTNTYFEGDAAGNPKARRGRSKEKRSACPLLTLGLVLDGRGFVRRSKTFAGNVSEGTTQAVVITTAGGETLRLQKELGTDGQEVRLYCHSAGREAKETVMVTRFGQASGARMAASCICARAPRPSRRCWRSARLKN